MEIAKLERKQKFLQDLVKPERVSQREKKIAEYQTLGGCPWSKSQRVRPDPPYTVGDYSQLL